MIVIPAIDLRGGNVVRLTHGDPAQETVYDHDPVLVAERYADAGARFIHVVDLDAALETGDNREAIRAICAAVDVPVQTGGGLRSLEAMRSALDAGAARVVTGTSALKDPSLLREALQEFGDAVVVALDVKGREVVVHGWTEALGPIAGYLPPLADRGVPRFLITQVEVDGTLEGPDLSLYRECLQLSDKPIIASGGVQQIDDLEALAEAGVEAAVVGKALYEGTVSLQEALNL